MLRSELIGAVNKFLKALQESEIPIVMQAIRKREKKVDQEQMLAAFTRFMQLSSGFGPTERKLMELLNLTDLTSIKFWAYAIKSEEHDVPSIYELHYHVMFALEHLPKFISLLARETDDIAVLKPRGPSEGEKPVKRETLSVIVIEDRSFSSPARLVLMLEAIQELYEASAELLGLETTNLCVLACDSGSDKSFDFLGIAEAIQCVKDIVLSFWDKVVYFREDKTGKHLDLIANSLPILEKIKEMNDKGTLEREKAELLRRQVVSSITKFGKAGVTIPEIHNFTTYNPRQLMRPEPKLLVAPTSEPSAQPEPQPVEKPFEDPELQKYLERMAQQFLKERRQKSEAEGTGESADSRSAQREDVGDKE